MNLIDYIADPGRKESLLSATGMSDGYLWQIATEWRGRRASPELAQEIEKATAGEVRCGEGPGMRADLQWMRGADGSVTGFFVPAEKVA